MAELELERLETFVGSTGGLIPLPVLEARMVEVGVRSDREQPFLDAHIDPQAGPETDLAARLALLRQDLAIFGTDSGTDDFGERRDRTYAPLDYFG